MCGLWSTAEPSQKMKEKIQWRKKKIRDRRRGKNCNLGNYCSRMNDLTLDRCGRRTSFNALLEPKKPKPTNFAPTWLTLQFWHLSLLPSCLPNRHAFNIFVLPAFNIWVFFFFFFFGAFVPFPVGKLTGMHLLRLCALLLFYFILKKQLLIHSKKKKKKKKPCFTWKRLN